MPPRDRRVTQPIANATVTPERQGATPDSDPDQRPPFVDFAAFYRADIKALVAFLVYLGADLETAADLAQETMIDALRSWASVKSPKAWTRRVASRKYGQRCFGNIETTAASSLGGELLLPGYQDHSDSNEYDEVLRLLGTLPPRQRQVMAWTFDGYGPQEIAAELGISPENVRSSLMSARRALAKRIEPAGGASQ